MRDKEDDIDEDIDEEVDENLWTGKEDPIDLYEIGIHDDDEPF